MRPAPQPHDRQDGDFARAVSVQSVRQRTCAKEISDAEARRLALAKTRRYHTLAAREQRRPDKLKWHQRAMESLWAAMGWGDYPDRQQGRLV